MRGGKAFPPLQQRAVPASLAISLGEDTTDDHLLNLVHSFSGEDTKIRNLFKEKNSFYELDFQRKATDTSRLGFVESKQVDRVNSGGVPLLLNRLLVLLVVVLPANEFICTLV
jgi:hypothetical protein